MGKQTCRKPYWHVASKPLAEHRFRLSLLCPLGRCPPLLLLQVRQAGSTTFPPQKCPSLESALHPSYMALAELRVSPAGSQSPTVCFSQAEKCHPPAKQTVLRSVPNHEGTWWAPVLLVGAELLVVLIHSGPCGGRILMINWKCQLGCLHAWLMRHDLIKQGLHLSIAH